MASDAPAKFAWAARIFVAFLTSRSLRPRFPLAVKLAKHARREGAEVPRAAEQLGDGEDRDSASCGDESQNFSDGARARVGGNNPVAAGRRASILRRRECFQGLGNAAARGRRVRLKNIYVLLCFRSYIFIFI